MAKFSDRMAKYTELRKAYPCFVYKNYSYGFEKNRLFCQFFFEVRNLREEVCFRFEPIVRCAFPETLSLKNLEKEKLDTLIFTIGLIELISYWKSVCSPELKILPHKLNSEMIDFWKKIYFHGLGEFFFVNGICADIDSFMSIQSFGVALDRKAFDLEDKILLPVGGGKDSVVSMELLKQEDIQPFIINPRGASLECVQIAGLEKKLLHMQRPIDKTLLELNEKGFLNGHTPFSAMLAFYSILIAALSGCKHIVLSNESSANESSVQGTDINHQYSKSFEFESDFRQYLASYIGEEFNYFSFLRPLPEIEIARLFSRFTKYHAVFKSCNVGSKTDSWCGKCPKCLFVYIILAAFMDSQELQKIFASDLLDDPQLLSAFEDLIGMTELKPFECVGTLAEVRWAIEHSQSRNNEKLPFLIRYYDAKQSSLKAVEKIENYSDQHYLNSKFEAILGKNLSD